MKKNLFTLLAICISGFLFAQTDPIICNPGFEQDLTDWNASTNGGAVEYTLETTDVHEGDKSLKASVNTEHAFQNKIESCALSLEANHTYKINFWSKTSIGSSSGMKVVFLNLDAGGTYQNFNLSIIDDTWREYSLTFTADADYPSLACRFSFVDVSDYSLDNVSITDISYIDCNGDLNGTAYVDNCNECVGGNTGKTSTCKTTGFTGKSRTLSDNFFGFNVISPGPDSNANFLNDMNILEVWKKLHAKIYRYPGGTYGNYYDWEEGTTIVGGRPGDTSPPITPATLIPNLPAGTDVIFMYNMRLPLPSSGYDWRTMTEAELKSQEVLEAKTQNLLKALAAFRTAGQDVKYMEFGNEFYFNEDESAGEAHGPIPEGGDGTGSHFPYGAEPELYAEHVAYMANAVKQEYPNIKLSLTVGKTDGSNAVYAWNPVIYNKLLENQELSDHISAVNPHWYQTELWYEDQNGEFYPQITDVASTKTAFGFAFDYITHKIENEINGELAPGDREIWVTEGGINDPSVDGTWVDGLREAITHSHYILMEQVKMYTPQKFQNFYMGLDLKLTALGKAGSMVFATAEDMTLVEELNLGTAYFEGEFAGPYPELTGIKCSDGGSNERLVIINCSENTYSNLDMSTLVSKEGLYFYQRHNETPWASDKADETIAVFDKNDITFLPYSITIISEKEIIDDLIEYDFIVRNPTGTYPDNYIKIFDFGNKHLVDQKHEQVLEIKNDGDTQITLETDGLSLVSGTAFSITQATSQTIDPGASTPFKISFTPDKLGNFKDTLKVLLATGEELKVAFKGAATGSLEDFTNYAQNGDFEQGIDVSWSKFVSNGALANYTQASIDDTHNGSVSGQVVVTDLPTTSTGNVRLIAEKTSLSADIEELNLSVYGKSLLGTSNFAFGVFFYDSNDGQIGSATTSSQFTLLNDYSKFSFSLAVPENTVTFKVDIRFGNAIDTYYFDDLIATGLETSSPTPGDLLITEVNSHATADASWIEIYNNTAHEISLTDVEFSHYTNGLAAPNATIDLFGIINPGAYLVIAKNALVFEATYPLVADYYMDGLILDGATDGLLLKHTTNGIIDQMSIVPSPMTPAPITDNALYLRKSFDKDGSDLANHWCEIIENKNGTPGEPNIVTWQTTGTNEWHNDANWDDTYAPCECSDVIIPSGGTQPVISQQDEKARNITIESAASLNINSGGSLTASEITINTDGNLFLNSNSTEYSSLIVDGTVIGSVNYSRYTNIMGSGTTGDNDLVSPPLSEQTFVDFAAANTNLAASDNLRAFGPFDNTATAPGAYINYDIVSDASITLKSGAGYRAATTLGSNLVYTGKVETGDVLATISVGSGSTWNLIGNPYPSYIRLDEFLAQNPGIMDVNSSGVYGYDGFASDGWETWNQAFSEANPDALIAPGQGFFVKSASGGGDITFTPIMRSVGSVEFSDDFIEGKNEKKSNDLSNTYAKIQISAASKTYNTEFYFNDNASLGLDVGYDASLYETNAPKFSIYSQLVEDNTGVNMAMQSINPKDIDNATIALGINVTAGKEITVSIAKSTLPAGIFVYLEDNVTNKLTLLNESDYTFTADEDITSTGRFFVSFKTSKVLDVEEEIFDGIMIYTSPNHKLFIKGQLNETATLYLFDVQGREVFSQKLEQHNNTTQIDVANFSTGIYIVQVKGNSINKTKKVIIYIQ